MSYRRNFGPESVEELKSNINSTHEEFLREDDPDKKADALRYMSAYAQQFLFLVPHDKKFLFKETERVLHYSSMNISDFDPREGSVAFEYLGRYAHNILDQPWRIDFRTIKLTSGYYVHNISSQLQNAHEILVAMGYVHTDEVTLKFVPAADAKKLKAVSRDMIVASQECLILSQIWQRVADQEPDYPLTIGEVFEYRSRYLGDTDTICKTLLSDIRRRNHEAKIQSTMKNKFVPVDRLIDYDGMEIDSADGAKINKPEKELDIIEHVLRNTRLMNDTGEEHIYDPVYNGNSANEIGNEYYHTQPSYHQSSLYNRPENQPYLPTRKTISHTYYGSDKNSATGGRDSLSPMIPKTVSNFCSNQSSYGGSHTMSNSSSMSSINGKTSRHSYGGNQLNQPLKFSKIPPEEAWNPERHDSKSINWSEYYGDPGTRVPSDPRRHLNDRTDGFIENGRSRKPIMPGDVYPDEYFPRVVKPTPIHSYTQPQTHYKAPQNRYAKENSGEDAMNAALAYRSEVNGIAPKSLAESNVRKDYYSHGSSLVNKGGWETDPRSFSSENSRLSSEREADKRSISSTETSSPSWDGSGSGIMQRPKGQLEQSYPVHIKNEPTDNSSPQSSYNRPSKIGTTNHSVYEQQRFSESSPDSYNEVANARRYQDHRDQMYDSGPYNKLSSSSSPSTKSPMQSPTGLAQNEEQPRSLDAVYYDYLLKKGHPDPTTEEFPEYSVEEGSQVTSNGHSDRYTESKAPKSKRISETVIASSSSQRSTSEKRLSEKIKLGGTSKKAPISSDIKHGAEVDVSSNYNAAQANDKHLQDKRIDKNSVTESPKVPVENEFPVPPPPEPWNCRFCTFKNTTAERICEVCCKSKDFFEEAEVETNGPSYTVPKLYSQAAAVPLEIPKPFNQSAINTEVSKTQDEVICPQCTLLNRAHRNLCEACDFRLRKLDSPPV